MSERGRLPYAWGADSPEYETGMIRDREIARWAAVQAQYFWLPCEICGEHYAGFETGAALITSWDRGHSTCAKAACRAETLRRNREWVRVNLPTASPDNMFARSKALEFGFDFPATPSEEPRP